jgi:carboxyl-terminal processing protease
VKGGPAAKNGQLKLGDRIVAVDTDNSGKWTDIMYLSIDKVVDLIRGKQGVSVRLRVLGAETGEQKEVIIVRDEVPMSESLASAKIVDVHTPGKTPYRVGILTLPSFYIDLEGGDVRCASDVKKLVQRMNREGVDGLIVDLRFNGGGSLEEVRKMVGFFTGAGPVVQVRDARGHKERLTVSGRKIFDGEMVVITNKLSASAYEIFAGAMADYGRAVIVGDESTFGKGTVQIPRSLAEYMPYFSPSEGVGMIKVTVQKFYRINGASTQLKGVASDIVLPMSTAALQLGEGELDFVMPYDEIPAATGYVKNPRLSRILPELSRRSAARVAEDKDMQYSRWYIDYRRALLETNADSLNKAKRVAENEELLRRQKEIAEDRKVRYAAMAEADAANLRIFRLKLDDVDAAELPLITKAEDEKYMEEVEDPEEMLEEEVDYPSTLDPILRESMNIVNDMLEMP